MPNPRPDPWKEIHCPLTHPDYPRGHLARYNAELGLLSCACCEVLLPAAELEAKLDASLEEFSRQYPGLREIDPSIAKEFLATCRSAFRGQLSQAEIGTLLLYYGHHTWPHVAPAYLRSLIAEAAR